MELLDPERRIARWQRAIVEAAEEVDLEEMGVEHVHCAVVKVGGIQERARRPCRQGQALVDGGVRAELQFGRGPDNRLTVRDLARLRREDEACPAEAAGGVEHL